MNKREIHLIIRGILGAIIFFLVVRNISQLNQICVIDDEFGYWGTAAYFSGYDWTGLSGTSPYYGYGIGFIYMWLFKIFNSAASMYKAAILINGLMLVISFYLSIICCKKIFPKLPECYVTLFTFFIALYPNTLVQSQIAWTETLLYLWFWVAFYLALKIIEKPSYICMNMWSVWLIYGMMIHQRTLGVICAGVLYIIVLLFAGKLNRKHVLSALIPFIAMVCIFVGAKGYLNAHFWKSFTVDIATLNDFGGQITKIQKIMSVDGIKDFISSIMGKTYYLMCSTMCIILPYAFLSGKHVFKGIKGILQRKMEWSQQMLVNVFLLCAFVASFLIAAIFMYRFSNRGDVFLYGRYVEFAIGPVLLLGLGEVYDCRDKKEKFFWIMGIFLCMAKIVNNIWLRAGVTTFHVTNCVGIGRYFSEPSKYDTAIYSIFVKFLVIAFISVILISSSKFQKAAYLLAAALVVLCVWMPEVNYNNSVTYNMQASYYEDVKDVVDILQEKSNEKIFYVVDDRVEESYNREVYERNIKYVQFYLYDQTIAIKNYTQVKECSGYGIVLRDSTCYEEIINQYNVIGGNHLYAVIQVKN